MALDTAADGKPQWCGDGAEALARISAGDCDLVIIDLSMEPDSPLQLLSSIRSDPQLDDVVCIGLASDAGNPGIQRALDLGIDDVLRLPLNPALARKRLKDCGDLRRLGGEVMNYWVASAAEDFGDHAACALEALPEAVIVLGPDATVEIANNAAAMLFDRSNAELAGASLSSLLCRANGGAFSPALGTELLSGQQRSSLYLARVAGGATRPVRLAATCYERFGRRMCTCVLLEVANGDLALAAPPGVGHRANSNLWSEVAAQALRRLEEARRHVETMRDQVFGPIGTAIYHSYLLDALSNLDQARHLLDRNAPPAGDRRTGTLDAALFAEMAEAALLACREAAELRHVALVTEIEPGDLRLRLPQEQVVDLLVAILDFTILATDSGDTITLRTQIASDRRLLIMIDASATAVSTAHLAAACADRPGGDASERALAAAWNKARQAARELGGKLEMNLDHPRGGFVAMAFLPQRRDGDPA